MQCLYCGYTADVIAHGSSFCYDCLKIYEDNPSISNFAKMQQSCKEARQTKERSDELRRGLVYNTLLMTHPEFRTRQWSATHDTSKVDSIFGNNAQNAKTHKDKYARRGKHINTHKKPINPLGTRNR